MKKFLLLFIVAIFSLSLLFSCGGTDGDGEKPDGSTGENEPGGDTGDGSGSKDPEDDGFIYSESVKPTLIIADSSLSIDLRNEVYYKIKELTGMAPDFASDSVEEREHEIIFGRSDRPLSVKAYRELEIMLRTTDNSGYYIVTDGNSIAIAYSDDGYGLSARKAVGYLVNNVFKDNKALKLDKSFAANDEFNLDTELRLEDKEVQDAAWEALLKHLGPEHGPDIVAALKELYSLYSPKAIGWFASLYDPGTGGFYHSNSGRDTYGYLPDVESVAKIFAFINASGMIRGYSGYQDVLPEKMKKEVGDFVYGLQSEDGFFYHPQWESVTLSRRGRDLSWSTDILKKLGRKPKYNTVTGVEGEFDDLEAKRPYDGKITLASKVVATAAIPDHLSSEEKFREYLEGLNIRENSYNKGNELSSQSSQIRSLGLTKILIEFLNENQFEENGLWHAESDYYGINGLMKISGIYSGAKVAMPNADKAVRAAIDAILSEELPGSVVSFYNPWAAVTRIIENQKKYGGEEGKALVAQIQEIMLECAPEAIRTTKMKVARHQREDGAFSYYPDRSVHVSQNAPVCVPYTVESDVAGACISITGITGYIFDALSIKSLRVPIYGIADLKVFLKTISKLTPIIKEEPKLEPLNFEEDNIGAKPAGFASISMKSEGSSFTVVEAGGSHAVRMDSKKGKGDAVQLNIRDVTDDSNGFIFSGRFAVEEVSAVGTKENAFLRFEFYDSDAHAYRIMFFKDGDKIRIADSSSNTPANAKFTEIAKIDYNEWIDLKLVYTPGDKNTVLIKIYVNGTHVADSHNYFNETGTLETPHTGVDKVKIFSWVNAADKVLMDDLFFVANNEEK